METISIAMDKVPLNILKADFAVTVDGGDEGELESECFNAWAATVRFTGKRQPRF